MMVPMGCIFGICRTTVLLLVRCIFWFWCGTYAWFVTISKFYTNKNEDSARFLPFMPASEFVRKKEQGISFTLQHSPPTLIVKMARKGKRKSTDVSKSSSGDSKKKDNNPAPSETSLTSSIFGDASANNEGGGSLSTSIFGNLASSGTNDGLFASAEKFQNLSNKRVQQNKEKTKVDSCTILKLSRQEIIEARVTRIKSKETIKITDSVTVDVPETSDIDCLDQREKEQVLRGRIKMFSIQCETIMRENGVVIIRSNDRMIEKELMKSLTTKSSAIEDEICSKLKGKGHAFLASADDSTHFKYSEVASRCLGRLDIRYSMDAQPFNDDKVVSNAFIKPVVNALLGDDAKLVYAGLILSFPGSSDQPWHRDGTALFTDDEFPLDQSLPPYALNVFIPLDDVTSDVGPTEFCVGSHYRKKAIEVMKHIANGNESRANIIGPLLKTGDALIYDYRVCHRGTQNLAKKKTRPMLYLMYSRPWFFEHINFGDERLFD